MKRALTYLLMVMLLAAFTGTTGAVEKMAKDDKAKKEQTAQQIQAKKTDASKSPTQQPQAKPKTAPKTDPKRFDSFVDENANGIDDRRENLKTKAITQKPQTKVKPAAPDTKKTAEKKGADKKKDDKKDGDKR